MLLKLNLQCIAVLSLSLAWSLTAAEDPVLVEDNEVALTLADFEQALAKIPPRNRPEITADSESLMTFVVEQFAEKHLLREAERRQLEQQATIVQQLQEARRRILRTAMLDQHKAQLTPPDFAEVAQERYDADPAAFTEPERIKIAQIYLVAPDARRAEVRTRAHDIHQRLQAGEAFTELAMAYSQGPNATRGGELNWLVKPEQAANPVVEAAFALTEVGALSSVLESAGGFHILTLLERQPERIKNFEEVQQELTQKLTQEYLEQAESDYLRSLYPSSEAEFNRDVLRSLLSK